MDSGGGLAIDESSADRRIMGKYDDAMYRYLSDNDRFADLFNAVLFDGRSVVQGELLEDASERCVDVISDVVSQAGAGEVRLRYEKSVRDMMRFGREAEDWQDVFHDYGMTLFCAGERNDLSCFGTDLKLLLKVLQLRQDKEELLSLWSGEAFSQLDLVTAETMAVMTDSVDILKKLERTEEGECNMCLAVEEMRRDWKAEGKAEGIIEMGVVKYTL